MTGAQLACRPEPQGGDLLTVVTDDPPTAAESARRSLARLELAGIRQRNAMRARLGLGDDELTTLLYLREHSQLTQGELVAISTLTRSGVGAMVNRLEEAGLIERVQDPGDKRVRLLRLSTRGAERMRQARGTYDDELAALLGVGRRPSSRPSPASSRLRPRRRSRTPAGRRATAAGPRRAPATGAAGAEQPSPPPGGRAGPRARTTRGLPRRARAPPPRSARHGRSPPATSPPPRRRPARRAPADSG